MRQLKKLNSVWKKDYVKQIARESVVINEYIKDVLQQVHQVEEKEDEIIDDIDGV